MIDIGVFLSHGDGEKSCRSHALPLDIHIARSRHQRRKSGKPLAMHQLRPVESGQVKFSWLKSGKAAQVTTPTVKLSSALTAREQNLPPINADEQISSALQRISAPKCGG